MAKLDNKVAIVTGSGSGIGAATAKRFAEEGAKVVLADVKEEIKQAGGTAYYIVEIIGARPSLL